MPTSPADLQSSLERHNAAFESLLKLIPPKYYIVNDAPDDQVFLFYFSIMPTGIYHLNFFFLALSQGSSKYQKNSKNQKAPKQAVKEATKKAKRDKVPSTLF
jgi:hypothetical protein